MNGHTRRIRTTLRALTGYSSRYHLLLSALARQSGSGEAREAARDVLTYRGDTHRACALLRLMLNGEVS